MNGEMVTICECPDLLEIWRGEDKAAHHIVRGLQKDESDASLVQVLPLIERQHLLDCLNVDRPVHLVVQSHREQTPDRRHPSSFVTVDMAVLAQHHRVSLR